MLWIPLVKAISLEPLNQSTSNLVYDVTPPKGVAIDFGPCAKTKMAAIELFNMYAIDTPCERDIFRTA